MFFQGKMAFSGNKAKQKQLNSLTTQSHKCSSSRQTSYSCMQQKCFMHSSLFITQIIYKYTLQSQNLVKLIVFTASSETFLSETEYNSYSSVPLPWFIVRGSSFIHNAFAPSVQISTQWKWQMVSLKSNFDLADSPWIGLGDL